MRERIALCGREIDAGTMADKSVLPRHKSFECPRGSHQPNNAMHQHTCRRTGTRMHTTPTQRYSGRKYKHDGF